MHKTRIYMQIMNFKKLFIQETNDLNNKLAKYINYFNQAVDTDKYQFQSGQHNISNIINSNLK